MSAPLFSVVMPAHNAERYIGESIDSVIAQTITDWELIVVDDFSTDGTAGIVSRYQRKDPRISMLRLPANCGTAHARNLGLDRARGHFIAFLDSDDVWYPEKTARQLEIMQPSNADICYTAYVRRRGHEDTVTLVPVPPRVTYGSMLCRNMIGCSTAMVRRATCEAIRMPDIRRRQDHGYWLALLRDGSRNAVGLNEPLVSYRLHPRSLSANKLVAARYSWKLLRQVERFGRARSFFLFSGYAYQAVKLRLLSRRRREPRPASPSVPPSDSR